MKKEKIIKMGYAKEGQRMSDIIAEDSYAYADAMLRAREI